jgi:frataxin-like iron-binding protein CyaY
LNTRLTESEFQDLVFKLIDEDPVEIVLNKKLGADAKLLAEQVTGRKKIRNKHPEWYGNKRLIMPPGLLVEQSSSLSTARY